MQFSRLRQIFPKFVRTKVGKNLGSVNYSGDSAAYVLSAKFRWGVMIFATVGINVLVFSQRSELHWTSMIDHIFSRKDFWRWEAFAGVNVKRRYNFSSETIDEVQLHMKPRDGNLEPYIRIRKAENIDQLCTFLDVTLSSKVCARSPHHCFLLFNMKDGSQHILRVGKFWIARDLPSMDVARRWFYPERKPNQVYAWTKKLEEGFWEFREQGVDVTNQF